MGPRAGALTAEFAIPAPLPPDIAGFGVTVARVETIRADTPRALQGGGAATLWVETLEGGGDVLLACDDGAPVAVECGGGRIYVGAWLDAAGQDRMLRLALAESGLPLLDLPEGLRVRETETERFWINYGAQPVQFAGREIGAADVLREGVEVAV